MSYQKIVCSALVVVLCFQLCSSLECYVCHRQEDNVEKCLKTIKTCEQGEDVCLTEIEWGSTPYWSQGSIKQYYVSKRCSSKEDCKRIRAKNMATCTHIWYYDWKCSECCQGDRCNYYVISGSSYVHITASVIVSSVVGVVLINFFNHLFLF